MKTINSVKSFLEQPKTIGIWYAEYDGEKEEVLFVNQFFSQTFGLSIEEILKRKKYQLINPPDTSSETIEQYKSEDREAMEKGYFLSHSRMDSAEERVVLKLGFDQGIVGIFTTLDYAFDGEVFTLNDLGTEIREILQKLRSDLL
jgi:PAS domain-containing protein